MSKKYLQVVKYVIDQRFLTEAAQLNGTLGHCEFLKFPQVFLDSLWYSKIISKRLLSAYTLSSSPFTLQSTHTCTGRRETGPDMPVFKS